MIWLGGDEDTVPWYLHHYICQGMVWNGMENGMEQKFRYEIWKMPEWNGMEDFKNGMEDNLPY